MTKDELRRLFNEALENDDFDPERACAWLLECIEHQLAHPEIFGGPPKLSPGAIEMLRKYTDWGRN